MAPVEGSGVMPAWITLVPNFIVIRIKVEKYLCLEQAEKQNSLSFAK